MRIARGQPDGIHEGATITIGWRPGDEHLIARPSRAAVAYG
jgi:hypothetical protein